MKLRLKQKIYATDSLFGDLADIVVDPLAGTVTHLVVEPHLLHHQSRLVPIGLVAEGDLGLTIQLDTAHVRLLQRVAENDFIKPGEVIEVGDDWDIGTEDIVLLPYNDYESALWVGLGQDKMAVSYDRIPKGECEIRRRSTVTTADGKLVGNVDGFLAVDDHLTAVIVEAGRPGFHQSVLVPFGSVAEVRNDHIDLSLDRDAFAALDRTDALRELDQLTSLVRRVKRTADSATTKLKTSGGALIAGIKNRSHR